MSISLVPYLNFPQGVTREAMTYYHSVFGGQLDISTFGDFNLEGMPADGVMHAALTGPGFQVMASDAMPGSENQWGDTYGVLKDKYGIEWMFNVSAPQS